MKRLLILLAAFLALFSFSVMPVAAHDSEDHDEGDDSSEYDDKDWSEYFKKRWDKDEYKKKAQERVDEAKKKSQEQRLAVKQEVCEKRKAKLEALPERLSERSQKIHNVFTKIYTRVQGFYASGQLTVENYDELKAAVDEAQMTSAESVLALGQIEFSVDCSDPNMAEEFASLREAAKGTKESLKDYRKALVELISSLRSAAADKTENETSGEDQ